MPQCAWREHESGEWGMAATGIHSLDCDSRNPQRKIGGGVLTGWDAPALAWRLLHKYRRYGSAGLCHWTMSLRGTRESCRVHTMAIKD